jgi:hypothetical protein
VSIFDVLAVIGFSFLFAILLLILIVIFFGDDIVNDIQGYGDDNSSK